MNAPARNVTVIPAKPQETAPGQPTKKKLRVAAYCRVSTDKDEQLNSFEVQKTYYTPTYKEYITVMKASQPA